MVVGKQAMTPLRTHSKVDLGGLKRGLGSNMGAFFSNKDAGQWSQDLRQRDEDLGRTPGAQQRRIQELNIVDQQNVERYSHQKRLKEEHERHAGGYGKLGAKDDRLSVRNSALTGDVTNNTPRFLETFPTKPKQPAEEEIKIRASTNPLLLGSMDLDPIVQENRSINYNPIVHKYIGDPRMNTDLQRRAKKERTGYVTIAGGRKDLREDMKSCDALSSSMRGYVEYEHQKVDPVQNWLHDEQMDATGGLRTFPAQKGVSPLTRRLVQSHTRGGGGVKDWHVNSWQRATKLQDLTQERIAVNNEQKNRQDLKMASQLSTFKIKDPYTDHMWGMNHEKEAVPYRGFNVAFQQHYHPEDEKNQTEKENATFQKQRSASLQLQKERVKGQTEWDIVHHRHKETGVPSGIVIPRPGLQMNKEKRDIKNQRAEDLAQIVSEDFFNIILFFLFSFFFFD